MVCSREAPLKLQTRTLQTTTQVLDTSQTDFLLHQNLPHKFTMNTNKDKNSSVTSAAKTVTSTLSNTVSSLTNTVSRIVGSASRGLGETVNAATGGMGKPLGDGLAN